MHEIQLRLRAIRRAKNLSQEELARQLGVSRQAIIALEQGSSLPSLPVIMALLRVLDIPFQDLFDSDWNPFRPFDPEESDIHQHTLSHYRHSEGSASIPMHMSENATNIFITAELAGVKEEDVAVDLSPQHILVMAIKKPMPHPDVTSTHAHDIAYGPLMRIITLPCPIDTTGAHADLQHGVLHLTLPKLVPHSKRRITFNHQSLPSKEDHGSE